jgi:hypothetical protein
MPPISLSLTLVSTCILLRSLAIRNNVGVWKLAATVWPCVTLRDTTVPSTGDSVLIEHRLVRTWINLGADLSSLHPPATRPGASPPTSPSCRSCSGAFDRNIHLKKSARRYCTLISAANLTRSKTGAARATTAAAARSIRVVAAPVPWAAVAAAADRSANHSPFSRPNDAAGAVGHGRRSRRKDQTAQVLRGQFLQCRTGLAPPRQRRGRAPVSACCNGLSKELQRARSCGCGT